MIEIFLPYRHHEKGVICAIHSHTICELIYYTKGHITSCIDGTDYDITGGTLAFYKPGIAHDEHYLELTYSVDILFPLTAEWESLPPYLVLDDKQHLYRKYFMEILDEYDCNDRFSSQMIEQALYKILVALVREQNDRAQARMSIDEIVNHVDRSYYNTPKIAMLAAQCGYSEGHFRKLFKEKTGLSPKDYVLNKQLQLAKKLLVTSDIALTILAENCGFENYSQFSLFFKTHAGVSPLRYRQQYTKKD